MKEFNKHNKKELSLNEIKSTGFKTPTNFLDSVEDDFFTKIAEEKLPKTNGFEVPKDYFNSLEDEILKKVPSQTKVINLRSRLKKAIPLAAAASVLLFIGINYFSVQSETITFDDISSTEIENWLENGYTSINTTDLASVLDETDFNDNELIDNTTIEDIEIEDYLNSIDASSLINEIN
ncbi:hypothetical protein WH52_06180 [Tenacibaculum holothuriorum]|uniref:Uncharacterized protein n=1 Tax=Tenacibaculum holothuriorum TaxID=1635173 RepID=A0A1Y2PFA9_9FLAO|nr:hypothetical protein [Tenacibaculum holothuriorum]OSY88348.1 hypothetical protein WH52_06180 [Tenacibaculum holothuriorum]